MRCAKMCTNSLPPASEAGRCAEQGAVVAHVLEHLDRDAAIEAPAASVEAVHVAVRTVTLRMPRRAHRASMNSRCGREFDTASMRACGKALGHRQSVK